MERKMNIDYKDTAKTPKERAQALLSQMTLKEKVGQLNQRLYGFQCYEVEGDHIILSEEFKEEVDRWQGLGVLYGLYRADPWSARDYKNGLYGEKAIKAYNYVQKYVIEHSRFGIPMLLSSECPHGHQALDGYLLPVNLCVGATFHPELFEKAARICGKQLKEMGVDLALVSMLDVLRDPRWGRSEECYGEDPMLCAMMAKAAVTGIQEENVAVVAKHFAAQGEGTGGINASAARIGERELREIHLPPMKSCCEAKVKGVMAAYNEIDGVFCHANPHLLRSILREEMGFDGIVMADGVAIDQLNSMTGGYIESGALALQSGVDVGLWDKSFSMLEEAVQNGIISEAYIDEAVLRVLTLKFERGLFEHPYLEEKEAKSYSYQEYPEALELARESVILLKNEENILPLNSMKKIAVVGPNADHIYHQLGDYTPMLKEGVGVTVLEGIQKVVKEKIENGVVSYAEGCNILTSEEKMKEEAVKVAEESDVVILVLGGSSSRFGKVVFDTNGAAVAKDGVTMDCGEGVDCADLNLPSAQRELAEAIFSTGKPVISVIISGRPMVLTEIEEQSKALLQSFYPGVMGGQAIAEVIFGKICPSGHLPVSMPRHTGQNPVYYNYRSSYKAWNYYDIEKKPLHLFGEGLSYTKFECRNIQLEKEEWSLEELKKQNIVLNFEVENVGEYDSSVLLCLYIHDKQASTVQRVRELKAFSKIALKKGEMKKGSLVLMEEDISIWNIQMQQVVEVGEIELYLKEGERDIWNKTIQIIR